METLPFTKYCGCGNDFLLVDATQQSYQEVITPRIPSLCHRQRGVGADGIIFLEKSDRADFHIQIFNSDGSLAEMCGNGLRCAAHFAHSLGYCAKTVTISTGAGVLPVTVHQDGLVSSKVELVTPPQWNLQIEYLSFHFLDTGVPHAVLFIDCIEQAAIKIIGPFLRYHPFFRPRGTNVTFASIADDRTVQYRTYERGVEAETLACGTGAAAAALAGAHLHKLPSPITVSNRSGDLLEVKFDRSNDSFTSITQTAAVKCIFKGSINLEDPVESNCSTVL